MLALSGLIDRLSRLCGHVASVLVLLSCLISAGNAVSRYLFSVSSNAWLEIQWQMFAGIFLLGAAQVLRLNEHVRVDLFYGAASPRRKLWIDVFGLVLFLAPAVGLILWLGVPWALAATRAGEWSANAGGLPVWPVKLLLPLGFLLLLLQGLSELVKRVAALQGLAEIETRYDKPVQ